MQSKPKLQNRDFVYELPAQLKGKKLEKTLCEMTLGKLQDDGGNQSYQGKINTQPQAGKPDRVILKMEHAHTQSESQDIKEESYKFLNLIESGDQDFEVFKERRLTDLPKQYEEFIFNQRINHPKTAKVSSRPKTQTDLNHQRVASTTYQNMVNHQHFKLDVVSATIENTSQSGVCTNLQSVPLSAQRNDCFFENPINVYKRKNEMIDGTSPSNIMSGSNQFLSSPETSQMGGKETNRAYIRAVKHAQELQYQNRKIEESLRQQKWEQMDQENQYPQHIQTFASQSFDYNKKPSRGLKPNSIDETDNTGTKKFQQVQSESESQQQTDIESVIEDVLHESNNETKEYRFKQYIEKNFMPFQASEKGIGLISSSTFQKGEMKDNFLCPQQVSKGSKQEPFLQTKVLQQKQLRQNIAQYTQETLTNIYKKPNVDQNQSIKSTVTDERKKARSALALNQKTFMNRSQINQNSITNQVKKELNQRNIQIIVENPPQSLQDQGLSDGSLPSPQFQNQTLPVYQKQTLQTLGPQSSKPFFDYPSSFINHSTDSFQEITKSKIGTVQMKESEAISVTIKSLQEKIFSLSRLNDQKDVKIKEQYAELERLQDEKEVLIKEQQVLLNTKEEQNVRLKTKIKACIHKIAEQEAYIQGKQEGSDSQLHTRIKQLTKQLEEIENHAQRVEQAYEFMMQSHAEKVDKHQKMVLMIKQENIQNIEQCAFELDQEKALRQQVQKEILDWQEKIKFAAQREVDNLKIIKTSQEKIRSFEKIISALENKIREFEVKQKFEDEKVKNEKNTLIDMLQAKSNEFQRDLACIGESINNMQQQKELYRTKKAPSRQSRLDKVSSLESLQNKAGKLKPAYIQSDLYQSKIQPKNQGGSARATRLQSPKVLSNNMYDAHKQKNPSKRKLKRAFSAQREFSFSHLPSNVYDKIQKQNVKNFFVIPGNNRLSAIVNQSIDSKMSRNVFKKLMQQGKQIKQSVSIRPNRNCQNALRQPTQGFSKQNNSRKGVKQNHREGADRKKQDEDKLINIVKRDNSNDTRSRSLSRCQEENLQNTYLSQATNQAQVTCKSVNQGLIDAITQTSQHLRSNSDSQTKRCTRSNRSKSLTKRGDDGSRNADLQLDQAKKTSHQRTNTITSGKSGKNVQSFRQRKNSLSRGNFIGDIEMFQGDNTKLMSTFRSSNGINFLQSNEIGNGTYAASTARLPDFQKIPSIDEKNGHQEFEKNQIAYTMVSTSKQLNKNEMFDSFTKPDLSLALSMTQKSHEDKLSFYRQQLNFKEQEHHDFLKQMRFSSQFGNQSHLECEEEKQGLSQANETLLNQQSLKRTKDVEQVVKKINQQYDKLMSELKRYKETKIQIEREEQETYKSFNYGSDFD